MIPGLAPAPVTGRWWYSELSVPVLEMLRRRLRCSPVAVGCGPPQEWRRGESKSRSPLCSRGIIPLKPRPLVLSESHNNIILKTKVVCYHIFVSGHVGECNR